ncbi:hypothetical protein PHLCEN_2v11836 [Hermanssonia centrifuga]|uniref:Sortilin C-terminal domain-containing protein n=1 Tax=Hermanssonia centrifuga TaxID=98765 RepID=A0A2R6NIQ2_9APHY|nr:hypothetical protein PHLCEN_2v11836 [Hermanssonia centrifuga]
MAILMLLSAFSTDEGLHWREYRFTDEKVRVKAIVTVPSDTSRRFILMGSYPRAPAAAVAIHIDFTALTSRQCSDVSRSYSESGPLATLASVPWFLIGLGGIAWEWASSRVGSITTGFRARRGYRHVPVDEDAQILRFEDEE